MVAGLVSCACTSAMADDPAQLEEEFRSGISASVIGETIRDMTAHPDFTGSPWDKRNAEKTLDLFRSWGWDAHIETFPVRFPVPREREVTLLGPDPFQAKLQEPPIAGDPTSIQQSEQLPTYFTYGPDGDVTAPIVYVNYGTRADYDELARLGVSVQGAIAVIRYGHLWRGGKVELAAEHGAKAALIYSDPKDDGYYRGLTYPEGGWRAADSVQRGSVLNGAFAGDPLMPFDGPNAGRNVAVGDPSSSMAKIPAMPLSYADALPLLKTLQGPTVPEAWRGALPITYRAGPGQPVHLHIAYKWETVTLYDVVATIKGAVYPDEWVIRGNHRDGWVYGAQDPHSGHSAMLEEARVMGRLLGKGWRPKRTIIYASWDGEEQGTLGSAAWVNAHLPDLQSHAVAYINTDVTGPGSLRVSGAPSFTEFLTGIAASVTDPDSGVSTLERVRLRAEANRAGTVVGRDSGALGLTGAVKDYDPETGMLSLTPPGYGSDHHAFVGRAGIPALLPEFGDQLNLGSYHSIYDDFSWYVRFGDPDFKYGRVTAQFNGSAVLRLAASDLLPQTFSPMAVELDSELRDLETIRAQSGKAAQQIDLAPIRDALDKVRAAAQQFDEARHALQVGRLSTTDVERADAAIMKVERAFLRPDGLPGRRYYRNEIYAPGRLWDTVPIPAVGDALLDGRWDQAGAQVPMVAATIAGIADALDFATLLLRTFLTPNRP